MYIDDDVLDNKLRLKKTADPQQERRMDDHTTFIPC